MALIVALVAGLVGLEVAARYQTEPGSIDAYFAGRAGMHWSFEPSPELMPGVRGTSRYTTNSWGLRGPEAPSRGDGLRIVCVGGSTTECTYLDDDETWPRRLEALLNAHGLRCWVGNAGVRGQTTIDHLRLACEWRHFLEIDCVVLSPGINDLQKHLNGQLRETGADSFWAWSGLYRWMIAKSASKADRGLVQEDTMGGVYRKRRDLRRTSQVVVEAPDWSDAIAAYQDRLRRIAAQCRRAGVKLMLVTQPVLWDSKLAPRAQGLCWMGMLGDGRYLEIAALREAMDRYNGALLAVGTECDVPVVDASGMSGRVEFFYDDCHLNELGAREMARLVSERMRSDLSGAS